MSGSQVQEIKTIENYNSGYLGLSSLTRPRGGLFQARGIFYGRLKKKWRSLGEVVVPDGSTVYIFTI